MLKDDFSQLTHGISVNLQQFSHQLVQVFFVGLTLGMMRTVVPALSESEFGVPRDSFMLLTSFVVAFGVVKGTLNFVAGRLSEKMGRRRVLFIGWLSAIPVPVMVWYAPSWDWIVAATILLGVNQGFAWSMTQTSKLDLAHGNERGFAIGMNEFSGYVGVAIAGVITAYLAEHMGPRDGLLWFGLVSVGLAGAATLIWVKETLPWARLESRLHVAGENLGPLPRYPANISRDSSTWEMFTLMSWRDKRMAAFCQAGLVEKFVDAFVWVIYPAWLFQQGTSLPMIGWIVGVYGVVWGMSQFITGRLSDRIGRMKPIVAGMWLCAMGVAMMSFSADVAWQITASAITGVGMALLYPNLSAAVADIAHPAWRGSAIGIYRFWRDFGYGVGALLLGITAASSGTLDGVFWFVAIAMFLSGLLVVILAEETLPRLNPADE